MHVTANISGTGTEWNVRAAVYLRCISDAVLCNMFITQGSFLKSRANNEIYGYTRVQMLRALVAGRFARPRVRGWFSISPLALVCAKKKKSRT